MRQPGAQPVPAGSPARTGPGPVPRWRSSWAPWVVIFVVLTLTLAFGAFAPRDPSTPTEQVAEIAATVRCPTCSGESVAVSDADISKQIRLDIAQRLEQGQSPERIRAFYAERYGDNILLTPGASGLAGLIWAIPAAVLVLAVGGLVFAIRQRSGASRPHATEQDRALVADALGHSSGIGALPGEQATGPTPGVR